MPLPLDLRNVDSVQELIELAARDTLQLPNSVQRNRTLAYLGSVAVNLIESAVLEERVSALESQQTAHRGRRA